jgi:hypothetical protein
MTAATTSQHSGAPHPAPSRARIALPALWFGLFGGPVAWSIQTLVNLPVASHGCYPTLSPLEAPITGVRGIAFFVSLLALAVCVAAAVVAFRGWVRLRGEHQEGSGRAREHTPAAALAETGEGRTRFMALCGVLTSLTFLVVSLVHTAAIFLVSPCAS